MQLENQTDHIAILSLMMMGVLTKRLGELGYLDDPTARHLHQLVVGVQKHAKNLGLTDLNILFENIDRTLATQVGH